MYDILNLKSPVSEADFESSDAGDEPETEDGHKTANVKKITAMDFNAVFVLLVAAFARIVFDILIPCFDIFSPNITRLSPCL